MKKPLIPRSRELANELAEVIVASEEDIAEFTFNLHGQRVRVIVDVMDEKTRSLVDEANRRVKYFDLTQLRLNLSKRL